MYHSFTWLCFILCWRRNQHKTNLHLESLQKMCMSSKLIKWSFVSPSSLAILHETKLSSEDTFGAAIIVITLTLPIHCLMIVFSLLWCFFFGFDSFTDHQIEICSRRKEVCRLMQSKGWKTLGHMTNSMILQRGSWNLWLRYVPEEVRQLFL